jgi:hypothetical protein
VNYLSLFHHFKAIYQFPKNIIFLVKIVANASLINVLYVFTIICSLKLKPSPTHWLPQIKREEKHPVKLVLPYSRTVDKWLDTYRYQIIGGHIWDDVKFILIEHRNNSWIVFTILAPTYAAHCCCTVDGTFQVPYWNALVFRSLLWRGPWKVLSILYYEEVHEKFFPYFFANE